MPILLTLAIVGLMGTVSDAHAQGPGEFKRTPSLLSTRSFHTATTLADARVLVDGGTDGTFVHRSAEIYDPATGDFTDTGEMAQFRFGHTATLMNDGRVPVTGGPKHQDRFIAEAEIYDPSTGEFAMTTPPSSTRAYHTSTLLQNGKVLIVGGLSNHFEILSSAELFDPATDTFSDTSPMAVSGTRLRRLGHEQAGVLSGQTRETRHAVKKFPEKPMIESRDM